MALDALHTAIMSQRVNWVLDADIRSFFDSVDHEWLLRMVAHRIADPRILRLIGLWLRAGVLESGEKQETDRGTPQGAGISPLLANIFLHYILDLWVHQWRRRHACGRVVTVRYAGFESKADALAGRTIIQRSTASTAKCVGPG
ncbi:reverse transcriptase domain-containing protein [Bradyrhizobium sp. CB2312]|uniref:reverse transcriptase domain-containing protein n=1 Tax=Bradyrhizobium sp. CB2312 TaxID=3039155 RepID=UPI0024B1BB40|nr:reverse transcriptase domain-containing protein [Bradyrhizobium sp. CB2312]WFU71190.1 reverse transcriptase domain-containing protein [Bradyrhizobium sp. CB2312]